MSKIPPPDLSSTLLYIRSEFSECRTIEREFRSIDIVTKSLCDANGSNKSPMEVDKSELRFPEGSLDSIELSKTVYGELDKHPRLRQLSRDMISCMNRVGMFCCQDPSVSRVVAMVEGRYVVYFWHHWRFYIANRRQLLEGRARVFVPFEHLVHSVSTVMLSNPLSTEFSLSSSDGRSWSANDTAFWSSLRDETNPMTYYYPKLMKPGATG